MTEVTLNKSYNFNNQDYEFVVRIYNGVNDVYLNSVAWEDLFLEEDIFDWKIKGSIVVNSDYETFERASDIAALATNTEKSNLVYKFRNDCRDTIFITIKPISPPPLKGLENISTDFKEKIWRIELEAVIYDVEELPNDALDHKRKKLYFWDKTYQLMLEKDSEFSTANSGSNTGKNLSQSDNSERSLPSVESLGALLKSDEDFKVHSKLVGTSEWETGDSSTKIFFSSPVGAKFIDNLNYLLNYTVSSANDDYQPCILKLERAEKTLLPKQFSLKSIKKYFQKAGNTIDTPGEYQNEHYFIYSSSDDENKFFIQKSPLDKKGVNLNGEIKGDNTHTIRGYRLVDLSGLDYSMNLANYKVVSYNSTNGQFNEEGNKHKAEEYKKFFDSTIRPNVLTNNITDRLVLTPFIKEGKNTKTVLSLRNDELSRLADGRNRLLKYYLFSNLAITFDIQGSTHRQTGRFFGVSKQSANMEEFDHKLEGQYFLTNIVHHFSNSSNSYMSRIVGVKTHTYEEKISFISSDVSIINPIKETTSSSSDSSTTTNSSDNSNDSSESILLPKSDQQIQPEMPANSAPAKEWTPWSSPTEPLLVEPNTELPDGSLFPPLENSDTPPNLSSDNDFTNYDPSNSAPSFQEDLPSGQGVLNPSLLFPDNSP